VSAAARRIEPSGDGARNRERRIDRRVSSIRMSRARARSPRLGTRRATVRQAAASASAGA
jgi:hypothetical protein